MPLITSFPPDRFAARTWRVADGATKQCSQCGPTHKPQRRQRTSPRALRVNCTGGFSAGAAVELAEPLKQQTNRVAQAAADEGENDENETTVRARAYRARNAPRWRPGRLTRHLGSGLGLCALRARP